MKNLFLAALVLASACDAKSSSNDSTEANLFLNYAGASEGGDGTHGMVPPFGTCALTAPGETIVLARATRDFEAKLYQPCEPGQPYLDGHLTAGLEVLRQSGAAVPTTLAQTLWFVGSAELEVDANTPADTMVLASLRRAGDEWVAMAAVIVDSTSTDAQSTKAAEVYTRSGGLITLPATWSDLTAEAIALRDDYATVCDENPRYFFSARSMSDDEFDTHIHTPIPQTCEPPPDAGTEPTPDAG